MNAWKPLAVGIAAAALATAAGVSCLQHGRGVRRLAVAEMEPSRRFVAAESAGLFIGVRSYTREKNSDVPFAVDDAVDLAYTFAFDPRARVILPNRITLALSGEPQKEESRQRLEKLKDAGAEIRDATRADILSTLKQQAALAGRDGILIVSLAAHGFVHDGAPYVLGSDSLFSDPDTAISAARIADVADESKALRSLLFVDACRERVSHSRGVRGQVVFYAAGNGKLAYDDPIARNGVFTRAVLDGLRCNAAKTRGMVTAASLARYVDVKVSQWVRENKDRYVRTATETSLEANSRNMPLAQCDGTPLEPTMRATFDGSVVTGLDVAGAVLWSTDVGNRVTQIETVDLDSDKAVDVVVAAGHDLFVLDDAGWQRWTVSVETPIRQFSIAQQWHRATSHIAVLTERALSIFDPDGRRLATREHRGELVHIAYGRPARNFAPKVVAATLTNIVLFDPKRLDRDGVWSASISAAHGRIERLQLMDANDDRKLDIAVVTSSGRILHLGFDGARLRP